MVPDSATLYFIKHCHYTNCNEHVGRTDFAVNGFCNSMRYAAGISTFRLTVATLTRAWSFGGIAHALASAATG